MSSSSPTDTLTKNGLQILVEQPIELLLSSPKTEFKSDDEYLDLLEHIFSMHFLIYDSQELLSKNYLSSVSKFSTKQDLEDKNNVYIGLKSLLAQLKSLMNERLSTTNNYKPRLERLSNKLNLTNKEKIALQYIVLYNIGIKFPYYNASRNGRGMIRNMALISNMSSREILNFLSPKRQHIKDGLFETSEDGLYLTFRRETFKMSKETLSALMGCDLTSEQFLKVDNTTLGQLLINEGVNPMDLPLASPKAKNKNKIDENILNINNNDVDSDVFSWMNKDKLNIKLTQENENENEIKDEEKKEEKISIETPNNNNELLPFEDDLDYLKEYFKVIELRIKLFEKNVEDEERFKFMREKGHKIQLRELKSSEKQAYKKCVARMELTRKKDKWLPRLERLAIKRNLDEFEKFVILTLVGCIISVDIIKTLKYKSGMTVGSMLGAHCKDLRTQIKYRKYFYKTSTLIKENIIQVHGSDRFEHMSDLIHSHLIIDRRMIDYCVALDTEFGALVEGSQLYTPSVKLEQVVLSENSKKLILNTINGMDKFKKTLLKINMNEANYIGNGVVILFHGISGTGKTMMANAIGNYLQRKILLIDYTKIGGHEKSELLLHLSFREAKIQNAIIFFDECEALFETRDKGSKKINLILNSIEKYDDIIILATNRPFDLDEAMYRRIQLAIEFPPPDIHLRQQIWINHIPKQVKLNEDVDLYLLSTEYELTGGFIRNAVTTALKSSLLRDDNPTNIILTQNDLKDACRQQIIGQLQLTGFNRRVIPKKRLNDIILDEKESKIVDRIIARHKSSKVLSGQWGYEQESISILITGENGVGKTTLAEVIAYECGKPMKVLTCSELLHLSSKIGHKNNIFSDLNNGAILVIEGCEILFNDSGLNIDNIINYLLFQIRRVTTMFIFISQGTLHSGSILGLSSVQKKLFSNFNFILKLPKPNKIIKSKLWLKLISDKTPIDKNNINIKNTLKLSELYPKFVHIDIKKVIINAVSIICLRKNNKQRILTYNDLLTSAKQLEQELETDGLRLGFHHMYT